MAMTRINNEEVFSQDQNISGEEILLGSDKDTSTKPTRNYKLSTIREYVLAGTSVEPAEPTQGNGIISGSVVPLGNLNYASTPIEYRLNGEFFTAPPTNLFSNTAHPTLNRIDIFVVNNEGQLIIKEGSPAQNPQEPTINFNTELFVTSALILAGATEPSDLVIEQVYDENLGTPTEWAPTFQAGVDETSAANTVVFNSVANPSVGTYAIEGTELLPSSSITLTNDTAIDLASVNSLAFSFLSKILHSYAITIKLVNDNTLVRDITINEGSFGLNGAPSFSYYLVNIPINEFDSPTISRPSSLEINKVILNFSGTDDTISTSQVLPSFYLDNIRLVSGGVPTLSGTNSYFSLLEVADNNFDGHEGKVVAVQNGQLKFIENQSSNTTLQSKTGSTIVFTENAEYNAASPLTTGNITLDNTDAIAGVVSRVYFNGLTAPSISGIPIVSRKGSFIAGRLNIYFFEYTTQGGVIMVILTDQTPQLISPINFVASSPTSTSTVLDWDDNANATNYVLERDINSDFSTAIEIYSGATSQFTDTGITSETTYYYRVKSKGSGFLDSQYSTLNHVAGQFTPDFTIVGLTENPLNIFENPLSGNYTDAYGVSTVSFTGDFEFSVELEASDVAGCMFGVSSHGVNAPFNDGTNPWSHLGYVRNSDNVLMYSTGTPTATATTVTYGSGNTASLRRVSNNLKLFFNETEAHDFGTVSGALFVHISTFHMFFIKNPLIQYT